MKRVAKDIMSHQPVTLRAEMSCDQAAALLTSNQITGAPVVDTHGSLLGVMTLQDLLKAETSIRYPTCFYTPSWLDEVIGNNPCTAEHGEGLVSEYFHRDTHTAFPDTPVAVLAEMMLKHHIHRVIIVQKDEMKPIGIVTAFDLLKVIVDNNHAESKNMTKVETLASAF